MNTPETDQELTPLEKLRNAVVDSAGLDTIPDPEPLLGDDILFLDSINWMVGKPGCMKSFTALDVAGCVGSGLSWHGHAVSPGKVLYLVAEGVRGTKKRVRAWEKSMGRKMANVWFLPVAVQVKNATNWDALIKLAQEIKPNLVVLDTQARITVGVEENSNAEMGEFVDRVERLRKATGACVLIIHHIGRNGDTGRGASNLDGALSTIIRVTKVDDVVTLECQKNKDGSEWDDIMLRAVPTADSIVLIPHDGGQRGGSGLSPAAMKTRKTWWESHGDKWVSASELAGVVAPKSTFYRHREELQRAGLVEVDSDGRYPRYRMVVSPAETGRSQPWSHSPTPRVVGLGGTTTGAMGVPWDSGTIRVSDKSEVPARNAA